MLCAGVTAYSALRKSGAMSGDWAVMMGAGGGLRHLGHLACLIASRSMGMRVIGIDSHEKKDFVLASGAERFIDYRSDDLKAGVLDITNHVGARAAFVLTASHSAYASALSLPKSGGTLVCVGIPDGPFMPISTACPQGLIARALTIIGVIVGDRKDAVEMMELAKRGIV
ncbi:hypothetical protein WHR41_09597, partial [Cladosporium halotolerans]